MLVIHKLKWSDCLSHLFEPYIEKGWKDEDRKYTFLLGFRWCKCALDKKLKDIGEEWWYIDVGYITEQITRYAML